MDTITHGIAGALISKALFRGDDLVSKRDWSAERLTSWAVMLGAIFPDSDVLAAIFPHGDMFMISWHRSVTHSLLCLPVFALILALLTQWFAARRGWACPPTALLALAYATGIASHIGLDYLNSFGIMLWSPLDWSRPAGDVLFILDFTLSAILLLPQLLAWIYEREEGSALRALRVWLVCVLAVLVITQVSQRFRVNVTAGTALAVAAALAAVIYAPMLRGRGLRISRTAWCRAGLAVMAAYLGAAAVAHHAALQRVREFIALEQIEAQSFAAMPAPPSLWHWDGLVSAPRGVYVLRLDLSQPGPRSAEGNGVLEYSYYPDAPDSPAVEEAKTLPEIRTLMAFMRFPVTRLHREGSESVVDFLDLRFHSMVPGRPPGFTYRVRLNAGGQVVSKGWLRR